MKFIEIQASERIDRVRNKVLAKIAGNKKWIASSDRLLDLSTLAFSREFEDRRLRQFELVISETEEIAAYGASEATNTGMGDYILEYVCLVLIDNTCIEAWTCTEKPETTYIAINGSDFCFFKSQWHKNFLGRWRSRWELFIGDVLFGKINTGGHLLFDTYFYSKHHVSWNSLKLQCEDSKSLPIHLATNDTPKDFLWAIAGICSLGIIRRSKSVIYNSNLVIPPVPELAENEEQIKISFLCNIVFRTMFFDLAFADKTSG